MIFLGLFLSPGVFLLASSAESFCGDFVIFDGLGFNFLGFVNFRLFFQSV